MYAILTVDIVFNHTSSYRSDLKQSSTAFTSKICKLTKIFRKKIIEKHAHSISQRYSVHKAIGKHAHRY